MASERIEVTRRILKAMRHTTGRRPFQDRDSEGVAQIVICLNDDTIEYATARVAAVGGSATVVVPYRDYLVPMSWTLDEGSNHLDGIEPKMPVHIHSPLGLLADYIETSDKTEFNFHFNTDLGHVDISADGDQISMPA